MNNGSDIENYGKVLERVFVHKFPFSSPPHLCGRKRGLGTPDKAAGKGQLTSPADRQYIIDNV